MTPRFSDLTRQDVIGLRILASLEDAYPKIAERQGNRRASVILAGHKAWSDRQLLNRQRGEG